MEKKNGFMLVELIIVVALIALGLFFSTPPFSFLNQRLVHGELEKLYARICYLQARAVATNEKLTVSFDEQLHCYRFEQQTCTLSNVAKFGIIPRVLGPPSKPTTPLHSAITFTQKTITFFPDGSMQSGAIYLTDRNNAILYALTIPIDGSCVRKYRYDDKKNVWVLIS